MKKSIRALALGIFFLSAFLFSSVAFAGAGGVQITEVSRGADFVKIQVQGSIITTTRYTFTLNPTVFIGSPGSYMAMLHLEEGASTYPQNSTSPIAPTEMTIRNPIVGKNTFQLSVDPPQWIFASNFSTPFEFQFGVGAGGAEVAPQSGAQNTTPAPAAHDSSVNSAAPASSVPAATPAPSTVVSPQAHNPSSPPNTAVPSTGATQPHSSLPSANHDGLRMTLPDLVISIDNVRILSRKRITVTNQGLADVTGSIYFSYGGSSSTVKKIFLLTRRGLKSGEIIAKTVTVKATEDSYWATADPRNQIQEENETNNSSEVQRPGWN